MERRRIRWSAAAALSAAALGIGGCTRPPPPPPKPAPVAPKAASKPATPSASAARAGADPYFGPGEPPAAVLLISGQMNGYLEPCGCTEGQSGGVGRRLDLIQRIQASGRPVVAVDLGGLINSEESSRGGPDQDRVKLDIALRALGEMEYAAIALSAADLRLGFDPLFTLLINAEKPTPLLAANVTPAPGLESYLRPSIEVEAGGRRLGITAVVDPAAIEALPGVEGPQFIHAVADPAEALGPVAADLETTTDFQVLLVQGPVELARSLAEKFPAFEVVVATSEVDDSPNDPPSPRAGQPLLVQVGRKGMHVGLVGLGSTPQQPIRFRDVRLDTSYRNVEPLRSLIDRTYIDELKSADVLTAFTRLPHPSGAQFVGAESCKQCHPKTYERWAGTKHAMMAYQAIESGPRGDRTADAECVSCHTTGFRFETGFVDAARTPWLKNQQCENCHGPASKHVGDPVNPDYLREIALTAEQADRERLCIGCHDADNDPHWNFAVRWPDVAHTDLDTYDDPAVKQGLDVEALLRSLEASGATGAQ